MTVQSKSRTQPIRVMCVDDMPDVTAVIQLVVDQEPDMKCVGCFSSANGLVEKARDLRADVVLMDATIPGSGKRPFDAMSELSRSSPQVKTIVYSGYSDQDLIDRAMGAGAWGCVSKSDSPEVIVRAVREVAAGNAFFPSLP